MTLSNGVGGGLLLGGEIYRGAAGFAGEVGHTVAGRGGAVGDAGIPGALEAYASGRGICDRYAEATGSEVRRTAEEIAGYARRGDAVAREVYRTVGRCVGAVVAAAINLLNLSMIVLGGGVSLSFDLFEESLKRTVASEVFVPANPSPKVLRSAFPVDTGLVGAAALAFRAMGVI